MSTETLTETETVMIHHPSPDVIVYQTMDYKRFYMINGNRALNQHKIKRIIADVEGGNDMLKDYPIQVKESGDKLEILDGQNRFFINRKLRRPIYYILVNKNKTMAEIARINSNVEKWSPKDYINCYINQGNDNYQRLQQFIDSYKINIGTSLRLLCFGNPGTEGSNTSLSLKFREGEFAVTHWEEAVSVAELCKRFEPFPFWMDRSFVIATYRIRKAGIVPMEDIIAAFQKNHDKLTKQLSQKGYIYNLEQILNISKQKRIVIS